MIKNIIFDLGGVLVPLNRNSCIKAFDDIGFDDFNSVLDEYLQGGFFLEYEKGAISTREFREIIRTHIDISVRDTITDNQIDMAMGAFLEPVAENVLNYIISIKNRYRIFLLSNTNPIAIEIVKPYFRIGTKAMDDFFEKMFLSYQMKDVKPNKEIFETLIDEAGLLTSETLFIDDSPANIETASGLGIQTLLFKPGSDLLELLNSLLA